MEIWKVVQSQRETNGKESIGMRMTSSKCYHTDDKERNDVWEKPGTEEIKIILKSKQDKRYLQ